MPRASVTVLLCILCVAVGCKSGKGQRGAMRVPPPVFVPNGFNPQMQPGQLAVFVRGDVRNPVIPWSEELTLARAILAAEYVGRSDPHSVNVLRGTKSKRFSTTRLLAGDDMDLEPGDVVEIRR